MTVSFISDLHLYAQRPAITELFCAFLRHRITPDDTLYILGDLFDAWLGDDAVLADQRPVLATLRSASEQGTTIFFMHGNRDFLAGAGFEDQSGCRLLPDPSIIELAAGRVLLMHGDTLCTDDHEYQAYRARVRHPDFRRHVQTLTLEQRSALAGHYRDESARLSRGKPAQIMDVNQQSVEHVMREHGVRLLIHGHTHRQAIHDFLLDGAPARRFVLGDWNRTGCVLTHSSGRFSMHNFDLDNVAAAPAG